MAKLYYGNGSCTIEGSDIKGVEIRYRGAIEINDKTSDSFFIAAKNNGILIFPLGGGTLNDLFDYVGEFKILSVIVADNNGKKVPTTIHRVMDYTELLNTNAEDMTTKSEDLSSTYVSGGKVPKTILKQPYIKNQHTSEHNTVLYLQDGTLYEGDFHVHLSDNTAMTGNDHTGESQDLYFKDGRPTKDPKSIPYAATVRNKRIKIREAQSQKLINKIVNSKNRGNY